MSLPTLPVRVLATLRHSPLSSTSSSIPWRTISSLGPRPVKEISRNRQPVDTTTHSTAQPPREPKQHLQHPYRSYATQRRRPVTIDPEMAAKDDHYLTLSCPDKP